MTKKQICAQVMAQTFNFLLRQSKKCCMNDALNNLMVKIWIKKMRNSKSHVALPLPVELALQRLGSDIAVARKLRGITTTLMAERAMIARNTLARVEKGDASVALGTYASVLFVLGMANRLGEMLANDAVTQDRLRERVPKRVRARRDVAGT